jgi:hypothetical protein
MVVLCIIRGKRHAGKSVLIQVDREGKGNFFNLVTNTSANEVSDPILLPIGQKTAAWSYRAIYMDSQTTLSDWCPDMPVAIMREALPFPEPVPNGHSVAEAVSNGVEQPMEV